MRISLSIILLLTIMTAQAHGQIEEQLAVWNVYCTGDNSRCEIAKEPVEQLMFPQFSNKVDWDTATAWLSKWKAKNKPAVWYVYCIGDQSKCVIAKEPTGDYMFKALGPVDWDTANAWLNDTKYGASFKLVPIGKGTSHTYNDIPFEIGGVSLEVGHSSPSTASISVNGKRAKSVHILDKAGWALSTSNNISVGHLNVYYSDGTSSTLDLIMGVNIAEWAYDRPENQADLKHNKVAPAFSWLDNTSSSQECYGHLFYANVDINPEKPLDRMELELSPSAGNIKIIIHAITLEELSQEKPAVWNVYCTGDNLRCEIAKEPVGQLMFPQFSNKVDWDTATAWLSEWKAENKPAVWNVYCTGDQSKCVIAKEPTGEYMFKAIGPVDWDTANAWHNNWKPK